MVRRLARLLLAAVFVLSGVDTLRHPEKRVATATPWLESAVAKVGDSLPEQVPTDPETLVKLDAGVKLVAGLGLAFGPFPRLCALVLAGDLVPTTLAGHAFWQFEDKTAMNAQRTQFLKNLGLIGGLLFAGLDRSDRSQEGR
ncbi:MAG TPA: DoxX family protein [Pseudonocardiaceae bacterium]